MKVCAGCGRELPFSEFQTRVRTEDGYYRKCHRCWREEQAASQRRKMQAYREKVRELVHAAKCAPCGDCNRSYPYYVMHFDHVRGEKAFNIGHAGYMIRPFETIQAEIDKCDLVCANCHAERTYKRARLTNPALFY